MHNFTSVPYCHTNVAHTLQWLLVLFDWDGNGNGNGMGSKAIASPLPSNTSLQFLFFSFLSLFFWGFFII